MALLICVGISLRYGCSSMSRYVEVAYVGVPMVELIGRSLRFVICTLGLCILGLKYALAKCCLVLSNSLSSVFANSEYSVLFCFSVM